MIFKYLKNITIENKVSKILKQLTNIRSYTSDDVIYYIYMNKVLFEKNNIKNCFYINYELFKNSLNIKDNVSLNITEKIEIMFNKKFNISEYNVIIKKENDMPQWKMI